MKKISTLKQISRRSARRSMIVSKYLFRSATRNIDFYLYFTFSNGSLLQYFHRLSSVRSGLERDGMSNLKFMSIVSKGFVYLEHNGNAQEKK